MAKNELELRRKRAEVARERRADQHTPLIKNLLVRCGSFQ